MMSKDEASAWEQIAVAFQKFAGFRPFSRLKPETVLLSNLDLGSAAIFNLKCSCERV
jgi:hypothetical protein